MLVRQSNVKILELAVLEENLEEVQRLISLQSLQSNDHYNILRKAIFFDKIEAAKLLINGGCQLSESLIRERSFYDSSSDEYFYESDGEFFEEDSSHHQDNKILHLAISGGNFELVELLIQKKICVHDVDIDGYPPIFKVVDLSLDSSEYSNFINCFLNNGARIRYKWTSKHMTILHYAAEKGNSIIVPLLVRKKCKIDAKLIDGSTALHIATKKGHSEVVKALLSCGADDTIINKAHMTPLCLAIENDDIDMFKILLQYSVRSIASRKRFSKRPDFKLLIYLAVSVENAEMIKLLLSHGATVNSFSTKASNSSFHLAVEKKSIKIMKQLLGHHGPALETTNQEGFTPLQLACLKGNFPMVSLLLNSKKCDLNSVSSGHLTALHLAVREGYPKIVTLLLEKGANYNVFDEKNKSPLTFALENTQAGANSLEIILSHIRKATSVRSKSPLSLEDKTLLKYHSKARIDIARNSILHLAVQKEDADVVGLILKHNACIDILNKKGHTSFDLAVVNGSLPMVNIFLKNVANPQTLFTPKEEDGSTAVHLAVEEGNRDLLHRFFKIGISAAISKPKTLSPLHIAVAKKDKNLIKLLLKNGAKVDVTGRNYLETPLFIAAENGNADIVDFLSEMSTNRSSKWEEGYLLLCIAAFNGHEKVVKLLLDKRVDPNANLANYLTPLHAAAQKGHEKIVDFLLERGARVNPKRTEDSCFISTPLLAASCAGHKNIVHRLIELGADVNAQLKPFLDKCCSDSDKEIKLGSYEEATMRMNGSLLGSTALHFAVKDRDEATVSLLINRGAVVNLVSGNGATPIGLAIENEDESMIKLLFSAGADVASSHMGISVFKIKNLRTNVRIAEIVVKYFCSSQRRGCYTSGCYTPLGIAVTNKLNECVKLLLEAQADVTIKHEGKPLLHRAVKTKNITTTEMLLKHGVDINATVERNVTALMTAVESGCGNIVQLLLDAGADTQIAGQNKNDKSKKQKPLHVAIENRQATIVGMFLKQGLGSYSDEESPYLLALRKSSFQVVEKFLNYGESINAQDKDGKSALFYAVEGNNLEVVRFLLKKGALLNIQNKESETVLHVALKSLGFWHAQIMIDFLLDYGVDVNIRNKNGFSALNLILNEKLSDNGRDELKGQLLKSFLSHGANPNQLDERAERTMLELAIEREIPELVETLIINGADVNFLNGKKGIPLNASIVRAIKTSDLYVLTYGYENLVENKELDNIKFDQYFRECVGNDQILPCRKIVRLLTKEVARRQAIGKIDEQNRISIESKYVKNYYERCRNEIELMKKTTICEGVTYYRVLIGNYDKLASLAKSNSVSTALNQKHVVLKLFPEYAEILLGRFEIGKARKNWLELCHPLLKKVLPYNFPPEIEENIFSFLTNRDLKNFNNGLHKEMFVD